MLVIVNSLCDDYYRPRSRCPHRSPLCPQLAGPAASSFGRDRHLGTGRPGDEHTDKEKHRLGYRGTGILQQNAPAESGTDTRVGRHTAGVADGHADIQVSGQAGRHNDGRAC